MGQHFIIWWVAFGCWCSRWIILVILLAFFIMIILNWVVLLLCVPLFLKKKENKGKRNEKKNKWEMVSMDKDWKKSWKNSRNSERVVSKSAWHKCIIMYTHFQCQLSGLFLILLWKFGRMYGIVGVSVGCSQVAWVLAPPFPNRLFLSNLYP